MGTLSGILFFIAFLPYIWSVLNGGADPSPVSWSIWATIDTLTYFAMKKEGAQLGQITGAVAGAWVVTFLALWFGKTTMGAIEWVSVFGALVGILLWKTTGSAVLAIVSSQIAILIGAIPTFVRVYHNPALEDPVAWLIWLLSCICALMAIKKWDIANALQPITFTIVEGTVVVLIVFVPMF